jgi:hypothetical protein
MTSGDDIATLSPHGGLLFAQPLFDAVRNEAVHTATEREHFFD